MRKIVTAAVLLFSSSLALAGNVAVVNSQSCAKVKQTDKAFLLVLYKGENIVQSILQCANTAGLSGASFTGLGAISSPTLNYFNFATKKYQDKTFPGDFELISLNGDVAQVKNKLMVHMHAAVGSSQYQVMGGHLSDGTISATAEITVTPFKQKLIRKLDPKLGAALIVTEGGPT